MFTYSKTKDEQRLIEELRRYEDMDNLMDTEEYLKNIAIDKTVATTKLKGMLQLHHEAKLQEERDYILQVQAENTAKAMVDNYELVKEYSYCLNRAYEIGKKTQEPTVNPGKFRINDYTDFVNASSKLSVYASQAERGLYALEVQLGKVEPKRG